MNPIILVVLIILVTIGFINAATWAGVPPFLIFVIILAAIGAAIWRALNR